uniref:Uncharacterized protein n=1 Tax=Panagrolaimus sp. PS1159 TaxID=55785 RepID=A0AC35GCI3_9BILA
MEISKEYFNQLFNLCNRSNPAWEDEGKNVWKAYYQFYYDAQKEYLENPDGDRYRSFKTLKFSSADIVEEDPLYESDTKQKNFISNSPLPKTFVDMYETNKRLYSEIKAVENDVEEWFKLVSKFGDEADDEEFVRHNVEYRLGSNLLDIKLWKLYIEYLRIHDSKEMLQIYSKYCRFFLDDFEMKEKYKNEVEKYGPVFVSWKNLFDFESQKLSDDDDEKNKNILEDSHMDGPSAPKRFCDPLSEEKVDNSAGEDKGKNDKDDVENESSSIDSAPFVVPEPPVDSFMTFFAKEKETCIKQVMVEKEIINDDKTFDTNFLGIQKLSKTFYNSYQNQKFPLKNPVITYILENAHHSILKKLHHTCKYFYHRKGTPICYKLKLKHWKTEFCDESLKISDGCMRHHNLRFTTHDLPLLKQYSTRLGIHSTRNLEKRLKLLENMYVTTTFNAIDVSQNFLSNVITRLYRCDAKYIYINCKLTINELNFLLQSGNAIIFKWDYYERNDESDVNESKIQLEDITQYIPRIQRLKISPTFINANTFKKLLKQKFLSKIYFFKLNKIIGEPFDTDDLLKFCIKNRAHRFVLDIGFHRKTDNLFVEKLEAQMMKYKKK